MDGNFSSSIMLNNNSRTEAESFAEVFLLATAGAYVLIITLCCFCSCFIFYKCLQQRLCYCPDLIEFRRRIQNRGQKGEGPGNTYLVGKLMQQDTSTRNFLSPYMTSANTTDHSRRSTMRQSESTFMFPSRSNTNESNYSWASRISGIKLTAVESPPKQFLDTPPGSTKTSEFLFPSRCSTGESRYSNFSKLNRPSEMKTDDSLIPICGSPIQKPSTAAVELFPSALFPSGKGNAGSQYSMRNLYANSSAAVSRTNTPALGANEETNC